MKTESRESFFSFFFVLGEERCFKLFVHICMQTPCSLEGTLRWIYSATKSTSSPALTVKLCALLLLFYSLEKFYSTK